MSYELFLHWKQGDEFGACLEECGGDVAAALRLWSTRFQAMSQHCLNLAEVFQDKNIKGHGDTHYIEFSGDEKALQEAARLNLVHTEEMEEERVEDEDC